MSSCTTAEEQHSMAGVRRRSFSVCAALSTSLRPSNQSVVPHGSSLKIILQSSHTWPRARARTACLPTEKLVVHLDSIDGL
jgi:hypothetical protein